MNTNTIPALLAALTSLAVLVLVIFLGASSSAAQTAQGDKTAERLLRTA